MTPRLTTDRLDLVPLGPDDADEMAGVLADPSLYAFTGGQPPTREALRERFERWAAGSSRPGEAWHNWIIRRRADGVAIGHVQATVVGVDGAARTRHPARPTPAPTADVAWLVGGRWQGQGYASEAARALVAWLAADGVVEVTAHIRADHDASARVAAAAGLEATDTIEDGEVVWRRNGASPGRGASPGKGASLAAEDHGDAASAY